MSLEYNRWRRSVYPQYFTLFSRTDYSCILVSDDKLREYVMLATLQIHVILQVQMILEHDIVFKGCFQKRQMVKRYPFSLSTMNLDKISQWAKNNYEIRNKIKIFLYSSQRQVYEEGEDNQLDWTLVYCIFNTQLYIFNIQLYIFCFSSYHSNSLWCMRLLIFSTYFCNSKTSSSRRTCTYTRLTFMTGFVIIEHLFSQGLSN